MAGIAQGNPTSERWSTRALRLRGLDAPERDDVLIRPYTGNLFCYLNEDCAERC